MINDYVEIWVIRQQETHKLSTRSIVIHPKHQLLKTKMEIFVRYTLIYSIEKN